VPRDPRHDVLFEPIAIGPKTLPNRFFQVPHCTGFGTRKALTQAAHRGVKAEGGWGGVCTEDAPVSIDSDEYPYNAAHVWSEDDAVALGLVAARAHEHGALAGIELTHSGAHGSNFEARWAPVAPSQIASDYWPDVVPKELDLDDIRRILDDWVRAAEWSVRAGFDIVYVYGAHSYLPGQFLSSFYNRRTDDYGGPLENRARFWLEALARVREAVAGHAAVAVRVAVGLQPGVTTDEALAFVRLADDLVDLWDVNIGILTTWSLDSGTSRYHEEGYQLEWTSRVREATAKPIVGVGRLTSPDRMAEIVRSRAYDIIGAARPSIADPFLPRKIEEGRYGDIRECTGSNVCIAKVNRGSHLGCIQNPTAGEEHRRGWHPEHVPPLDDPARDFLIVGAGPAGMECALTLGRRGARRVHLVDAAPEIGGCMRWIPRLADLGEWGRVVNWRRIQLDRLRNVEVITGTRLDADAIVEYGADVVIVATGSHWDGAGRSGFSRDAIAGADPGLAHVLTPEQVMLDGKRPPGGRVAVFDAEGYVVGTGIAQVLAREGLQVELVTPFGVISPLSDYTLEGPELRASVHRDGVTVRRDATLTAIAPGLLSLADPFGGSTELQVDGVVLCTQRLSDDALHRQLDARREELGVPLYRAGDCVAPRQVAEAIFDGHRLAREIEQPDPSVPMPHRLELHRPGS
jgi:dimethylamine/trimethylamine dehydrogenase